MRRSILGENHSSVGRSLAALGELRLLQDQASDGAELLEQAHRILTDSLPPGHPELDELDQNIARLEGGATSPLG
jgi:hypothetical protein